LYRLNNPDTYGLKEAQLGLVLNVGPTVFLNYMCLKKGIYYITHDNTSSYPSERLACGDVCIV